MSEQNNSKVRVEALERIVLQMTEQIKTLINVVELINHGNTTAPTQSVNNDRVDNDIPPYLGDVDDGNDAEEFKRQLEYSERDGKKVHVDDC